MAFSSRHLASTIAHNQSTADTSSSTSPTMTSSSSTRRDVDDEDEDEYDEDEDESLYDQTRINSRRTMSSSSVGGGGNGTRRRASVQSTGAPPNLRRSSSSATSVPGAGSRPSSKNVGAGATASNSSRSRASPQLGQQRRSSTATSSGRIPIQPPKHPEMYDTEEAWKNHHDNEEKTEGWHHLPLLLVILPPLGAVIHGRAENWSDGIVITLVCFYLYQLIKVPWDIYYASHSRVVIDAALPKPGQEGYDPQQAERRSSSARQLKRTELLSLLSTMLVPFVGSYLLYYAKGLLSDPERYINRFMISLFAIATSIKPFLHFAKLVKNSEPARKNRGRPVARIDSHKFTDLRLPDSLYHQEQVWYPSTEVHFLRRRVEALEKDLSQLTRAFATKDDVRNLRDGVDVPLSQLSKAVRRFDRKEEYLRLSSEERFALLEQRLEEAARERQQQQSLIEQLRFETHQGNILNSIFSALRVALGGGHPEGRKQRRLKWFEKGPFFWVFLPINAPRLAIEYVSSGSDAYGGLYEAKTVVAGMGPAPTINPVL